MIVKELIEKLSKLPEDASVLFEDLMSPRVYFVTDVEHDAVDVVTLLGENR